MEKEWKQVGMWKDVYNEVKKLQIHPNQSLSEIIRDLVEIYKQVRNSPDEKPSSTLQRRSKK